MTITTHTLDGATIIDAIDSYAEILPAALSAGLPSRSRAPHTVRVFTGSGYLLGQHAASSADHARMIARREIGS